MKKQLLFAFGAAALLASCSSDNDSPVVENLYDGYLHVKGTINEVKTRANDNGFEANDKIGISGGIFSNVAYEYSSDSFTAVDDQITVSDDNIDLTAYYPYNESLGSSDEISFNLTDSENHDYLFASGSASRTTPQVTFQFSHKMAQVSLKVVDETEDNVLDGQEGTITLKNVATTGTFNTKTGAVTAETANQSITVSDVEAGTTSDDATEYTVILPSYTSNEQEINVILAINEKTYSGKIKPALAAGTKYTYTLTISDTSSDPDLTISSATVSGWTPGTSEDIAMEEDYVLQVGDFLLANGTTCAPTATNAADHSSDIIGVVYYVGNPLPTEATDYNQDTNDVLYKDFYKTLVEASGFDWTEHGLALGIKNAKEGTDRIFSKAYEYNEDTWFSTNKDDYLALYETSAPSQIKGYNNTSIIKKVYEESGNDESDTTGSKALIELLSSFDTDYNLTEGAGWYLPSAKELLIWGENLEQINKSLQLVSGATQLTSYSDFNNNTQSDNFYWSSDMYNKTYNWAYPLTGDLTTTNNRVSNANNSKKGYIRFAIAF